MFGSEALEVGIGLIFVYLLLSLAVTAGTEIVAAVLRLRARVLRNALINFIDTRSAGVWERLRRTFGRFDRTAPTLVQDIYKHPLVSTLAASKHGPSYLPSRTFALVLMDVLGVEPGQSVEAFLKQLTPDSDKDAGPAEAARRKRLLQALRLLAVEVDQDQRLANPAAGTAQADLPHLREKIEDWFNASMSQVSGWYKRWAKVISFLIAALIVVASNADTLTIVHALSTDDALRESLVAQAEIYAARDSLVVPVDTTGGGTLDAVRQAGDRLDATMQEIRDLGVPLGWKDGAFPPSNWLSKIIGLLLTTLALTLGAPFWFDLLQRVVDIRADARSPRDAPADASKEDPSKK